MCHIINLIVQDGLKLISPSLQAIRSTILFLDSSNKLQEFYILCFMSINRFEKEKISS